MIRRTAQQANGKGKRAAFAMLFAVLASSLLVTVGLSIFGISLKELQIATTEQQSEQAYYAADSAEECALYWDIKEGAFPTCLGSSCAAPSTSTTNTIECNGAAIPLSFVQSGLSYAYATSTFFQYATGTAAITQPNAGVSIVKTFCPAGNAVSPCRNFSVDTIVTEVDALGHNTGISGRRVERGISEVHNSQ